MTRVRQTEGVKDVIAEHPQLFVKHPDADQLSLALFLLAEHRKGDSSFWWPYLEVMNESDLACFWEPHELEALGDFEIKREAEAYRDEVLIEWDEMSRVLPLYPELFGITDKAAFLRMYNFACTRCFGWTLPSTMMVPLADFLNHQPCDTQYEIY